MEKKERIISIRLNIKNWMYAKKILKRYNQSKQYSFNKLLNHLLGQHIALEKKEDTYHLKIEILDLAKQKEEITQQLKEKQILYEAKKEGLEQEEIKERIETIQKTKPKGIYIS